MSFHKNQTLAVVSTVILFALILMLPGVGLSSDTAVVETVLETHGVVTYGKALKEQVAAGDGGGVDATFRNSGVALDLSDNAYFAVNGVHPVQRGDYSSYYPKSIVKASLEDDTILEFFSFSKVNGRDTDMEALTFATDRSKIYIGDEYNYIYELELESGKITNEWDLADVGIHTNVDKGIEALTYAKTTGYFYAGIQGTGEVLVLELTKDKVSRIASFSLESGWAPSGLYAHSDGSLYVVSMRGRGTSGNQKIFKYDLEGTLQARITIPASLGMTRPDGIAFDEESNHVYIVDSQGPIYEGFSLYRIPWTNQGL